jgi:hypothetical protein
MPLLSQSDWRIDNDVESKMGPAGCYDACITTAAITALANRNPGSITPRGRSAEFDAIKGEVLASGALASIASHHFEGPLADDKRRDAGAG